MIEFNTAPPPTTPDQTFTLRRLGTQPIEGWITSTNVVGVYVHYWKGRTRPHTKNATCEACENGNVPRWKGYLTLWNARTASHWLQEITPAAYDGIKVGLNAHGELRGHGLTLARTNHKNNAPMKATVWEKTIDLRTLPPGPDIIKILFRIWDIPEWSNAACKTTARQFAAPTIPTIETNNGKH